MQGTKGFRWLSIVDPGSLSADQVEIGRAVLEWVERHAGAETNKPVQEQEWHKLVPW